MAKVASKIRKRDLDPQLFMELVSQVNGKINMQELLTNYVSKDDVIGEYQLPPKYRTEVTKELANLDASVQDIIKKDTEQDAKHLDLEQRMQVVENTMHIGVAEDQDVSPIIGTQVAANTTNISRNSAAIKQLDAQLTVQADTEMRDKLELQNSIENLSQDVDDKLELSDKQVKEIKNLLEDKRNIMDLITLNDLDPQVKKDMETVISIGEKTASAFTNLDNVLIKVDECTGKVDGYEERFSSIEDRASADVSELNQKISALAETIESTSATRVQTIGTELQQIRQDTTAQQGKIDARFQSIEEEQGVHKEKLDIYEEKIENIAQGNRDNESSIGATNQNVDAVSSRVTATEAAIKQTQEQVAQINDEMFLQPSVEPGKTLCVTDISGTVVGKDLFYGAYFAKSDSDIVDFQAKSLTPIFSPVENVMYVLKTAEEIAKETEEANKGTVEPENPGADIDPWTDEPSTDNPPTDEPQTDEPVSDEPGADTPPTDEPSTDNPSEDGPSADEPGVDNPPTDDPGTNDPSTDNPPADEPGADEPSNDEPISDQPSEEDPSTDDPSIDDPAQDPSAEEGTDDPVSDEEIDNPELVDDNSDPVSDEEIDNPTVDDPPDIILDDPSETPDTPINDETPTTESEDEVLVDTPDPLIANEAIQTTKYKVLSIDPAEMLFTSAVQVDGNGIEPTLDNADNPDNPEITEGTETPEGTENTGDEPGVEGDDNPDEIGDAQDIGTPDNGDGEGTDIEKELTDEQKAQVENARKYNVIENFLQRPENRCIIMYDMAENNVIRGYSDNLGVFHDFTAFTGTHKPTDVEVEAGASVEIERTNADARLGLEVRLLDQVSTSQTYGKWINSEGVATIAYGEHTVTIYNSSDKIQKFRILEG